jgi:hypothetical protein
MTSPTIVELGAIKQFSPHFGNLSSTGSTKAMNLILKLQNYDFLPRGERRGKRERREVF